MTTIDQLITRWRGTHDGYAVAAASASGDWAVQCNSVCDISKSIVDDLV